MRKGARIKDAALLALDKELERLEAAVVAAGGEVHWARDGVEACRIVASLVRGAGTSEAMLIVQLAGDRQSHILVPAIHRNRTEIRDLFRGTIGPPDVTDEPAALAEAAPLHLRELRAGPACRPARPRRPAPSLAERRPRRLDEQPRAPRRPGRELSRLVEVPPVTPPGRSPSSRARPPPPTSSSTTSRACTAPGGWRSSSSPDAAPQRRSSSRAA